jgi:hypothetical protein
VGVTWAVVVRLPLIALAPAHLDSDLAVDGLTLIDAFQGHWRWHYPGTPHMGTPPVLLSLVQAAVFGPTAQSLVSGGVLAYVLVMIATFGLAWRAFGSRVAGWSVLPLAIATPGLIWLSGRITGGHLLSVAWFAATCGILACAVSQPTARRLLALGLAAGSGAYVDRMLLLPGVVASLAVLPAMVDQPVRRALVAGALLLAGLAVGFLPAKIGEMVDPYDAYGAQFETILRTSTGTGVNRWAPRTEVAELLDSHSRILALECLPRLLTGHRLPDFRAEPWGRMIPGISEPAPPTRKQGLDLLAAATTVALLGLAIAGFAAFLAPAADGPGLCVKSVLAVVSLAVLAGFVLNRHIYNSDNYRYLVLLILPWSIGIGRAMAWASRKRRIAAVAVVGLLAVLTTMATYRWYDGMGLMTDPRQPRTLERGDPAWRYLAEHSGSVDAIFADYWDAYRLSFLTGGRVVGVPYPNYPNRFPGVTRAMPGGRPRLLMARRNGLGAFYLREALAGGGELLEWP